ncbi:Na(+)/H(+) antiporter [Phanerochaete sordida]|uniref:Na(+)/H(+) antiporter n=1 Tax=Phanerochaete sordida TaxID=48140 RepID=A0A9P3LB28_9APHY|nr:Na(+)/H(+) antiporter [Phanerochaete sordida]
MRFHPFEVSIPHIIYAAVGGFVVFFGMFSLFIREKLYIGEACWAFVFGVVIGPYGANIFDPRSWGNGDRSTTNTITLEFTRVVLAIGVFAIGVELPKAYMRRHWRSLFFLLAPIMTWGWFVSAALIFALIPGLNFLSSLAVAACLTPTDPILAAAVVGGKYADKHVPAHLRHLLAAESGCNDGAAYPFLWIALYLVIDKSTGRAVSDWFLILWLYQIILAVVFGTVLGVGFRYLMRFCEKKDLIDRQSYVAQYVALALLTIGSCTLLGTDDLLAAFSCGAAFAWDGFFNKQTEEAVFSSVIDLLFNIAAFVFVGAWTPFNTFSDVNLSLSVWRLIVIGILVILLRRLPVMIALYRWIPDVKTFREAIFSGHFGPMGIGAIYISTLAAEQLPEPSYPPKSQHELLASTIQPIVAFMVLCSILVHGLSIPFFSLGRRVHSVSRTWSRHDTFSRSHHTLPEWANMTRHVVRGHDIVINRDSDMERGEATVNGDETPPTEKVPGSDTSPTQTTKEGEEPSPQREEDDYREENPPDGREVIAEWKEGPHNIVEKRAGPGEEVEVEVQRNVYGPGETTNHTLNIAQDKSRHAVEDIRTKLSQTFSPEHPPGEFERALDNIREHLHNDVELAGEAVHHCEDKVKHALGTSDDRPPAEEEDEGWQSDGEGETSAQGATRADEASETRRQSRSPKSKPPKLAILRTPKPPKPPNQARRRSIRRGMLGARVLGRHYSDPGRDGDGLSTPDESDEDDRGRRSSIARNRGPASPIGPGLGPRHARIDSLRSIESRSRMSRDASPARSIRWADEDGVAPGRLSGSATPAILSPTTPLSPLPPLPITESGSHGSTAESGDADATPTYSVRFSVPTLPGNSRSS